MDSIAMDPWLSALVIFINQIVFLYARTLNVIYTAEKKVLHTLISGNIIGIAWLVSISLGANALLTMQWQPIVGYLLGGSAGVLMAFRKKI